MSKARVIVLSVIEQGLTKAETARKYDVSWRWVHTLVKRYEQHGLHGLEPRSRAPRRNSRATPEPVKARILELRTQLHANGLDNGPVTIAWHLEHKVLHPRPRSPRSDASSPTLAWSPQRHVNARIIPTPLRG
ncbi:helix-turn-helix domain-containing protein [Ornithinimicrobium sp. INDO-MA30-4]|uniref:helix-turn-helix domain-containing protein n=1 Tax=Ornithinimicrobium sp. INDO-MA30-4 TaxID=2908651 RepID=UPI001F462AE5|nr:helix-turn-helix domain-containing protein [Ornithinimicrobium sp. INDO-MA30-4]UJH71182.1 helix-turn-helix domain-containing protein [Ornithinimicrobium sp. INDO-MA30-4]